MAEDSPLEDKKVIFMKKIFSSSEDFIHIMLSIQ